MITDMRIGHGYDVHRLVPDRKLITATLSNPNRSNVGLTRIPPPMPQMEPATEARKLTAKYKEI